MFQDNKTVGLWFVLIFFVGLILGLANVPSGSSEPWGPNVRVEADEPYYSMPDTLPIPATEPFELVLKDTGNNSRVVYSCADTSHSKEVVTLSAWRILVLPKSYHANADSLAAEIASVEKPFLHDDTLSTLNGVVDNVYTIVTFRPIEN